MKQRSLTVVAPVTDPQGAARELAHLAHDTVLVHGSPQPALFHDVGVHFARLVLIEEAASNPFQTQLVLESNYDATTSDPTVAHMAHLGDLVRKRHSALGPLFACCAGFGPRLGEAELAAKLTSLVIPSAAEYQGHTERDLARIALEARLREVCTATLAKLAGKPCEPRALYHQLRTAVKVICRSEGLEIDLDHPAPPLPDPNERRTKLHETRKPWARQAHHLLPIIPCLPCVLWRERLDRPFEAQREAELVGPLSEARARGNAAGEDRCVQNALSHLSVVKPGFIRRSVLVAAQRYLNSLCKHHFDFVEQLGGIPTIHFARWSLTDSGKRLLFCGNYDGSWESYLGDFVGQAAIGLNLAWNSTEGFPRTRALIFGGARDAESFKAWARAHQRPTQVFYRAYPTLSVSNINNNTWLRHGLHDAESLGLDDFFRRLT